MVCEMVELGICLQSNENNHLNFKID